MSVTARAWLATRGDAVPPSLQQRMAAAVAAVADETELSSALAAAALDCLRDALRHGDARAAALHLLAADGLITYACEAAAELGIDALTALHEQLAPAQLALLVTDPTAS